jgi:pSer/pThr/pTyr-binding forkhead associated (FHA) protein
MPDAHRGKRVACSSCSKPLRVVSPGLEPNTAPLDRMLTIVEGPMFVGERIFIGGNYPIRIGKRPDSHIVLSGYLVSRRHCELVPTDTGWRIEDRASTNGVYVNDERTPGHDLRHGDRVRLGEFHLLYVITSRPSDSEETATAFAIEDRVDESE